MPACVRLMPACLPSPEAHNVWAGERGQRAHVSGAGLGDEIKDTGIRVGACGVCVRGGRGLGEGGGRGRCWASGGCHT